MASIEEILGKKIDSVKALRAEIKSLQDSLVGVDAESQEFKDTTQKLTAAQDELTKVTRAGKSENDAAKDSLVGLRQEYKQLYDQYKLLSEEQRNSSFGKEMASQLEGLSTKINDIQKGVGDFRGNVGRYAQSITDAFDMMGVSLGGLQGPLKLATGGFKTLTKSILASPIGWISAAIAALIAIFKKMKEAVGQNEELQMRYNEAMAKFQPIIDAAKNALNNLAEGFVSFVEFVSNAVQKIREFIAGITDFLRITKDAKKDLQDEAKLYGDLEKRINQLIKTKRDYEKLNSEDQARLDTLKSEAAATTDLAEKKKLLEEAQTYQQQINERNIEIATEYNDLLKIQASLTQNDTEMEDKLAATQVKVNQTVAEGARKMKELNSEMKSTTSSINSTAGATRNYRQEAKELYKKLVEESKDPLQRLTEEYERNFKSFRKYNIDTTLLTKKYNTERAKLIDDEVSKERAQRKAQADMRRRAVEELWELLKADEQAEYALSNQIGEAEKVLKRVREVDKLVNSTVDGMKIESRAEFLRTALREGFAALPDEFKNIKDAVDNLNDSYDLNIENIQGLANAIPKIKKEIADLNRELVETRGKKVLNEYDLKARLGNFSNIELEVDKLRNSPAWKELDTLRYGKEDEYAKLVAENEYNTLMTQKNFLERSLEDFKGTYEQKMELMGHYYEVLQSLDEKQRALDELSQQRTLEMVENLTAAIDSMANAMGTYQSSQEALIDSQQKAGKIDEKEARAKKKRLLNLQAVQTAFNIATITADAASGIFAIWKGYAQERGQINPQTAAAAGAGSAPVLAALNTKSLVSAIAQTASLAATASAQIMAARNGYVAAVNNFNAEGASSSGSEGLASTPALIASEPYTYTQQIQNTEEEDELNQRPIVCSIVDIENMLNVRKVRVEETTF